MAAGTSPIVRQARRFRHTLRVSPTARGRTGRSGFGGPYRAGHRRTCGERRPGCAELHAPYERAGVDSAA